MENLKIPPMNSPSIWRTKLFSDKFLNFQNKTKKVYELTNRILKMFPQIKIIEVEEIPNLMEIFQSDVLLNKARGASVDLSNWLNVQSYSFSRNFNECTNMAFSLKLRNGVIGFMYNDNFRAFHFKDFKLSFSFPSYYYCDGMLWIPDDNIQW